MKGSPPTPSLGGQSDNYALWDAAYVLGSLSEADRRAYEAHLGGCRSCRQSVDQLSGMPALLGQLSVDEVAAIDDRGSDALSSRVLPSLLAKVRRRRRTARLVTWTAAAAAAAVLAIGALVAVQFHPGGPASVSSRANVSALTMTPVVPTELTATVTMTGYGWGTQIDMNCAYRSEPGSSDPDGDEPGKLAMVVVGRDGRHERLANWMVVEGGRATPGASTSMALDQIETVQIVSADTGYVLLQRTL